jgi:hypothetical protein
MSATMRHHCTVPGCGCPTNDFLCAGCVAQLVTALRQLAFAPVRGDPQPHLVRAWRYDHVGPGRDRERFAVADRRPGLIADLQDLVTRQVRLGGSGRPLPKGGTFPLPFNVAAAELAWVVDNTVSTWARDFAESNPHLAFTPTNSAAAAEWMAGFPALLALHPAAAELHAEITGLTERVRRMVDTLAAKVVLGACGALIGEQRCTQILYGDADEHGRPDPEQRFVRCRVCGSTYHADVRRRQMQLYVRAMKATAAEIAQSVGTWFGQEINVKTLRTWAGRGKIASRGSDVEGVPLYRVGDVLDYAATRTKAGRKQVA